MRRIALLIALLPSAAFGAEIACPAAITTPVGAAGVPGWIVAPHPSPTGLPHRGPDRPGRNSFEGVTIVDGGPGDLQAEAPGTLVPDESAPQRGQLHQRWGLAQGGPRGFLMVCRYIGTATVLAQVLPATMRECVQLRPERGGGGPALSAICR